MSLRGIINYIQVWSAEYEPSRAVAVVMAIAGFAGLFGYGQLVTDLSTPISVGLGAVAAIVVAVQNFLTRRKVYAPATVDKIIDEQAEFLDEVARQAHGTDLTLTDEQLEQIYANEETPEEPYYDDDLEAVYEPKHRAALEV